MILTNQQRQLYDDLMALTIANDAFYFQDFTFGELVYRVFNYRLASYTDFLAPGAIECRGITFSLNQKGDVVELVSRPMQKFFNRFENPSTMDVDLNEVESIEYKSDGSLISTYSHDGSIRLKTKGSLFSDQAIAAMKWMEQQDSRFVMALWTYDMMGYTVNLEWVAPDNRIVIGYMKPQLIVLNIRHRNCGSYIKIEEDDYLYQFTAKAVDLKGMDVITFVNQIPNMLDDLEGFVVKMKSGLWMKIKTNKYLALHHCKDSVNNPRRLWEVIVNEGIDDVRAMFHEDELLIKQIDEMQAKVDQVFNSMIIHVESFYNANKDLDRKDFAIKGQAEVDKKYFSLVMNLYLGKPNDYKQFLIKHYKMFGIQDTQQEE